MLAVEAPAQTTELSEVVRKVLTDQILLASEKNIDLSFLESFEAVVRGEHDSIVILIRNLVDNAIRYTPENGSVSLEMAEMGSKICLTVSDSGPGIPSEFLDRITDRFYRVPGACAGGSGLGLSIVKTIADRIGATLEFFNRQEGGLLVRVSFSR